ncbi:SdrD B-like domain-containing protein, partial [Chloroflexota bacterium]
ESVEVTFTVTDGVGGVSPATDTTDHNGVAQTVLTTAEAGTSTVQASATVIVGGQTFNLVTDGAPGSFNAPAEKTWDCPAAIGDFVWHDVNLDGLQNDGANSGLADVTVTLLNADKSFVDRTETDANGYYLFSNLEAGSYIVDVDQSDVPSGLLSTTFNDPMEVTLAACQEYLEADFGYGDWGGAKGIIGDLVWYDTVPDGVYNPDDGEYGIPYVRLFLYDYEPGHTDPVRTLLKTTWTDCYGNYFFYDNTLGWDYWVDVDFPSPPLDGLEPVTVTVIKAPIYSDFLDADFPFVGGGTPGLASIGDHVWVDHNLDGIQNDGPPHRALWWYYGRAIQGQWNQRQGG